MVLLNEHTVDEWLKDRDAFCLAFMEYSFAWHHAVGADLELLRAKLEEAHARWATIVQEWKTNRFRQEAASLSYTKVFGILLWVLSETPFVGAMADYEPFRQPAPEFAGTDEDRAYLRNDLLGAPEVVTAFQFVVAVLNFYESKRIDRKTGFVLRITEGARHDFLVMLHAREVSPLAVYMTLEAFYSRH
jgi:hypothetical protein